MNEEISRQLSILNQIDKEVDELYHKFALNCGLSDAAFWIVYIISQHGNVCTQKEICKLWSYSSQTINSALKSLELKGYIYLEFIAGNRKSKHIMLTDIGREFVEKNLYPMLNAERISLEQLTWDERSVLVELSIKRAKLFRKEMEKALY